MRFLIIVKATADSEAGTLPSAALLARMGAYNDELAQAGALLDANGLKPSSAGWRVQYRSGGTRIVDGPFAETKELVAGYTLIDVPTRDAALEWSRRFPAPFEGQDCEIEVRQLYEWADLVAMPEPATAATLPGADKT